MPIKSLKRNYIYNLINQILVLITPLITTPYISRVLSADGIGQYSFTSSVVSYFVLFATMGTTIYGQREISYCQDDKSVRSKKFWEIEILSCITVLATLVVYIFFLLINGFQKIYLIQIFTLLAVATDVSWLFTGMEEFKITVIRNIVFKILNIIFIFMAVRSKGDLLIYVFGLSFIQFLSTLSLWPSLKNFVEPINMSDFHPFSHLKENFTLFVPTIAIQIYTVLDKTMIGLMTNSAAENGYYEQSTKIVKITLTIITALSAVTIPRIGAYFSNHENDKISHYMYQAYNFVWLLGIPLCFGLAGISKNFVPWFLGDGFEESADLIIILSFLILAIGINNVTGMQYLIPTKRQNLFTISVCIGALVNFVLNSLLIPHFLAAGAAVASVIAETTIAIFQLIIVRKELSIKKIGFMSLKYLIAGIIMLGFLIFENFYLSPSILHTLIMIITGIFVYSLTLLIEKDKFFIDNMNVIIAKLKISNIRK